MKQEEKKIETDEPMNNYTSTEKVAANALTATKPEKG